MCPRGQTSETFCRTEPTGGATLRRVDGTFVRDLRAEKSDERKREWKRREINRREEKWKKRTDEIRRTKGSELVMGVRTKGKMRIEESVGGSFEWDFDWEGVKRRQRSEER